MRCETLPIRGDKSAFAGDKPFFNCTGIRIGARRFGTKWVERAARCGSKSTINDEVYIYLLAGIRIGCPAVLGRYNR